jgi:hypothetical protein
MAQGFLPFQIEAERGRADETGRAGLMVYAEFARALGMREAVQREVGVRAQSQGYSDDQVVSSLILLNLAGGESVSDLDVLEADRGFCRAYRFVEEHGLSRRQKRELRDRFPKGRERTLPSCSAAFRYLDGFSTAPPGPDSPKAYIPPAPAPLLGLRRVNGRLLAQAARLRPVPTATLDTDATVAATFKSEAKACYKGFKAYQPLNVYWWERDLVVHSEFREGNVPAGYELDRALMESLEYLPAGVKKVYWRSDSAGYDHQVMGFCDDGESKFGRIEFAVSCDVTAAFKAAVQLTPESEWRPLMRKEDGREVATGREWAEVCFVPNQVCAKKRGREYRYLATREVLREPPLPGMSGQLDLPFPTLDFNAAIYKVFGVATNRDLPGDQIILWHDRRAGRSEEAHAVMKNDLAGSRFPSGAFGENAAWWSIMILAFNLHSLFRGLVLGGRWERSRLKALRFHFINLPGRVFIRARRLVIRIAGSHPSLEALIAARGRILSLARSP